MSDKIEKFGAELDALIADGDRLLHAIQYACHPRKFEAQLSKLLEGDPTDITKFIKNLPNFRDEYQSWYSKSQEVIKQVLPSRFHDFISYYEYPRIRKEITYENYMIRDYLQGLKITRGDDIVVDGPAAIPEFMQQLNIVKAARSTLSSSLMDLKSILQADLFDSEIESAEALAKAGYLRAAGAICGVVLEKHLHHVCDIHRLKVAKKHPNISDLIQILKDANVITVAQWRFIQSLADTRNICDHAKGREPTKDEIKDLVAGTGKILKQVY